MMLNNVDFKAIYTPFCYCFISNSKIKEDYFLQTTAFAIEKGFKRTLKKLVQIHLVLSFGSSLTKKPNGSRIGKGKGAFANYFTPVKKGSVLFHFKNKTKRTPKSSGLSGKTSIKLKLRVGFPPATQGFFAYKACSLTGRAFG